MKTAEQVFEDAKSQLETWGDNGMKRPFGLGKLLTGFGGQNLPNESITEVDFQKLDALWRGLKTNYANKYKYNNQSKYLSFRTAASGSGMAENTWDLLGETDNQSVGFVYHIKVIKAGT